MNKKTFEEYMSEYNLEWKQILPMETIKKAKMLYNLKDCYQETNKILFKKQTNKSGIDYTDYFKNNNLKLSKVYYQLKKITLLLTSIEAKTNNKVKIYN